MRKSDYHRNPKTLGQTICKARMDRGMTQAELSKILKVTDTHLCIIEQGKRFPSSALCLKILAYLNIPTDKYLCKCCGQRIFKR